MSFSEERGVRHAKIRTHRVLNVGMDEASSCWNGRATYGHVTLTPRTCTPQGQRKLQFFKSETCRNVACSITKCVPVTHIHRHTSFGSTLLQYLLFRGRHSGSIKVGASISLVSCTAIPHGRRHGRFIHTETRPIGTVRIRLCARVCVAWNAAMRLAHPRCHVLPLRLYCGAWHLMEGTEIRWAEACPVDVGKRSRCDGRLRELL